ncbi:MAG: hypothetical protein PVJ30_05305 [Thiohalocapsa sp.]|jgi:hypothetical protein|uniref:hypothetical protein n=1 Tax=Thiohalocapsa sp. TaxID=2497641 RepID=UPI0025E3C6C2|nr:hypothetical protein [Thiohalocapsa sp.]
MSKLDIEDRLSVMEMAAEIASEAARNPNVVWMIEFQEELIERLYRKMTTLIEAGEEITDNEDD